MYIRTLNIRNTKNQTHRLPLQEGTSIIHNHTISLVTLGWNLDFVSNIGFGCSFCGAVLSGHCKLFQYLSESSFSEEYIHTYSEEYIHTYTLLYFFKKLRKVM